MTILLRPIAPLLVGLVALLAGACGPINTTTAVGRAEEALDLARVARAPLLAPYDYWMAESYLAKAKRTEGYSEFEAAERFAEEAETWARKAIDGAEQEDLRRKTLQERLRQAPPGSRP